MIDESQDYVLTQVMDCAKRALNGEFGVLSTGEQVTAAVLLNRADWLAEMHYTIAEAICRIGPTWMARIPEAVEFLRIEGVI